MHEHMSINMFETDNTEHLKWQQQDTYSGKDVMQQQDAAYG